MKPSLRHLRRSPRFIQSAKFIAPIFLDQKTFQRDDRDCQPLRSIPGFFRLNRRAALAEVESLAALGIQNLLIYPLVDHSRIDVGNSGDFLVDQNFFLLEFTREIRRQYPSTNIILDLCLCHLSSNAQCGIVCDGVIENDASLELLKKLALEYARAGATALMISGMIDGAILRVRERLEIEGFYDTVLMAQSAKLDSALYGPFQKILTNSVKKGYKKSYQVDAANGLQMRREMELDRVEGADVLVVKPTFNSLDTLAALDQHLRLPVFSYMTGGEYALLNQSMSDTPIERLTALNAYFQNLERVGLDAFISYAAAEYLKLCRSYEHAAAAPSPEYSFPPSGNL